MKIPRRHEYDTVSTKTEDMKSATISLKVPK